MILGICGEMSLFIVSFVKSQNDGVTSVYITGRCNFTPARKTMALAADESFVLMNKHGKT